MIDELRQFIIALGRDELVVGILAIFGLAAAVNFTFKYGIKSAFLASSLAKLGFKFWKRRRRKLLQEKLVLLIDMRSDAAGHNFRNEIYSSIKDHFALGTMPPFLFVVFAALSPGEDPVSGPVIILLALITMLVGQLPVLFELHLLEDIDQIAADPVGFRSAVLKRLKAVPR